MSKPFLIATPRIGLERDMEPEWLPNDAYPDLEDCYMFRGRIQRRRGFNFLGRLVEQKTQTFAVRIAPPDVRTGPLTIPGGAVQIQPGSVSITDTVTTFVDDGMGNMVLSAGSGTGGPIDYFTGAFLVTFTGAAPAGPPAVTAIFSVYFGRPVMGLRTRELPAINAEQLIAFDTAKANVFSNTNQMFQDITFHKTTGNIFSWTGSNSNFFWTTNYLNAFWATNSTRGFQATVDSTNPALGDGLRWYDGTGWINFLPQVDGSNFLMGSLIIVSFRNRLVMLNTTEGTAFGSFTNYPQRARWCQNGTPYYVAPVPAGYTGGTDTNAWRSDIVGKGGFIDAPTQEQIVSAEFYKDTLIVFFERSTWQLRYTGNETLPFIWERINVDFGAESTFSIVPFDAGIVAVGNYGIISCDATGVKRIDQIIPDEVFNFHNGNDGPERVYGIRDYPQQLVYWTFPAENTDPIFPNRVLIFNYLDGSYSFFNDSFTCFGNYQPFNDTTWADLTQEWQSFVFPWNKGALQSDFPEIVAGNQQGFVFNNINNGSVMNSTASFYITGASQAIPCVITSPNHNLSEGQIILITAVNGMTQLNGHFYRVSVPITANTFAIQSYDAVHNIWVDVDSTGFGAYINGGLITVRNSFDVVTKRFNPFLEQSSQIRMNNLDLLLEGTETSEFTMNVFANENSNTPIETEVFSADTTTGQDKMWVRIYTFSVAQFIQIELTLSDAQMVDPLKSESDFVLHAMTPWFAPSGRLIFGEQI
jgi:hypothetical protein